MTIARCQDLLATTRAASACSAPKSTFLAGTGQSILQMAKAYEEDGKTFLSRGDSVNALAAFLYGLGWLHCGFAAGILTFSGDRPECPFGKTFEKVPPSEEDKLAEKSKRYARLLTTAIAAVSPAPDRSVPAHGFAQQVRFIAGVYLAEGNRFAARGDRAAGLACYSYGHGWLDCGVEAGLFCIHANREIFTVD